MASICLCDLQWRKIFLAIFMSRASTDTNNSKDGNGVNSYDWKYYAARYQARTTWIDQNRISQKPFFSHFAQPTLYRISQLTGTYVLFFTALPYQF